MDDDLPTCDGCRLEVPQVECCPHCGRDYCPACYDDLTIHWEADCAVYAQEAEYERDRPYSSRGLSRGDFWSELH